MFDKDPDWKPSHTVDGGGVYQAPASVMGQLRLAEDEITELRAALADAVRLLDNAAAEGHNLDLDVMRFRRRHHKVVPDA